MLGSQKAELYRASLGVGYTALGQMAGTKCESNLPRLGHNIQSGTVRHSVSH